VSKSKRTTGSQAREQIKDVRCNKNSTR